MLKVRLQTQPHGVERKSLGQMAVHVVKGDGFSGLYRGVSGKAKEGSCGKAFNS